MSVFRVRRGFFTKTALLGAFFTACAPKSAPIEAPRLPSSHLNFSEYRGLGGWTCPSTRPFGFVEVDELLGPDGDAIVAHERDHKRIAKLFVSCEAYQRWVRVDANWLDMEASGFCEAARNSPQMPLHAAYQYWGHGLANNYPFGLTTDEAVAIIRDFCEGRRHITLTNDEITGKDVP